MIWIYFDKYFKILIYIIFVTLNGQLKMPFSLKKKLKMLIKC